MSQEKTFTKLIPHIYKCRAESLGLFFFVKAQLQTFPTMTIDQSIQNFRKFTGITIDEWSDESMKVTYQRVQLEYYRDECTKKDQGDS